MKDKMKKFGAWLLAAALAFAGAGAAQAEEATVTVNGTPCATLKAAFEAAKNIAGEITIAISAGTVDTANMDGIGNLANKKATIKGAGMDATELLWLWPKQSGNGGGIGCSGAELTFEDLALTINHNGHGLPYVQGLEHPKSQLYKNVKINGSITTMDDTTFEGCLFTGMLKDSGGNNVDEGAGKYSIWVYGGGINIIDCTFMKAKNASVKLYGERSNGIACCVSGTTFESAGSKGSAIYASNENNIDKPIYEIYIDAGTKVEDGTTLILPSGNGLSVINPVKDEDGKITSGTFITKNTDSTAVKDAIGNAVAEGIEVPEIVNGQVVIEGGEKPTAVAKIVEMDKEFETLEAAYAEVQAGETIKILVDEIESLGEFPMDVTIEGVEGRTTVVKAIGYRTVDNVTLKNLKFATVDSQTKNSAIRFCYVNDGKTFKIDNCEFDQQGNYCVHFDGSGKADVIIENTKLKGWCSIAEALNSLTISNCLFEAGNYAKIRPYINCEIKDCRFTEAFVEKSKEQAQSGYGPAIDMVVKATDAIAVEVDGCSVVDSDGKPSAKYGLNDLFNSYSVTGSDDKPIAGGLIAVDAEKDENGKYVSGMLAGLKDYLLTQIGTKCTLSDVSDGVFSVVSSQKPEVEVKDESGTPAVKDAEGQPIPEEKQEDAKQVADDVKTEVTQTLTEPEVAKFEGTGVAEAATETKQAGEEQQIIEVKPEVVEALQKEVAKQDEKDQITKDSKVESRVEIVFNALEVKVDAAAEVVKATETSVQYEVKPKVKTTVITTEGDKTEEKVVETVIPNEVIKGNPIKFRLAVDSTFGDFARVKHTGTGDNDGNFIEEYLAEVFAANDASGKKFVELSSDHFSTFKLTSTSETPVCRVGDKNYTSLADAIANGGATAEIVLTANVELTEDVTLGYNQTIDPSEFAISGAGTVKAADGYEVRNVNGKSVVYVKPTEVTVTGDQKIAVCIEPSVLEQLGGATALATVQANGFQVWQNYVMGVDGATQGNKLVPICKPNAENPGAAAVTITTPMTFGAAPAKTGITVTYQLLKSATPKSGFSMVGEELSAPVFAVDTSAEENATYWKIQAIFTPDAN